jgi:hypothetical protein
VSGPYRNDGDGHLSSDERFAAWASRRDAVAARRNAAQARVAAWIAVACGILSIVWPFVMERIVFEWWLAGLAVLPVVALVCGSFAVKFGGRSARRAGGAAIAVVVLLFAAVLVFVFQFRAPIVH